MEACEDAHYMARKFSEMRHKTKLIPPHFVQPFVKINKNDFFEAETICEVTSMRFVALGAESQQRIPLFIRR